MLGVLVSDGAVDLLLPVFYRIRKAKLEKVPYVLVVGDDEILLDDCTAMAEAARAAGVDVELTVWPELIHVFQAFPPELVPEAATSVAAAGVFAARHLGRPTG